MTHDVARGALRHRFVLISRWRLDCSIEAAWQCLCAVRDWSRWWPQVLTAETDGDDCTGATPRVGRSARLEWRTGLGYGLRLRLTTTGVLAPFELEGVVEGDLDGHGLWLLEPQARHGVRITYRWDVQLNRPWMRLSAPLLRPLFARNHFSVMRDGANGMARHLGCCVSECEDFRFSPGVLAPAAALRQPQPNR